MEIPYTVRPRPDTGLANPKLGIWLFIASEVMLFGGLFAGYIFMRLGAEPWMWPHGWLNVPVGTFNTFILIASSVTVILSWEALKMRNFKAFKGWLAATWICGLAFLAVKLGKEWPDKFNHFGAYIQKADAEKYDEYLGNNGEGGRLDRNLPPRLFVSGHAEDMRLAKVPYIKPEALDGVIDEKAAISKEANEGDDHYQNRLAVAQARLDRLKRDRLASFAISQSEIAELLDPTSTPEQSSAIRKAVLARINVIRLTGIDEENHSPKSAENDRAHFIPRDIVHLHEGHEVVLHKKDLLPGFGAFLPRLNTYLACYFMITGLHGLHVLGGVLVFLYFWGPGSKLYKTNPEQLCNRIEVAGLFWHLVDLVWIFVFPIFYLL
jgi:cytochrome c oxidase subunit 3